MNMPWLTVYFTVDGQLGYCQVGNITNTPAMDILVSCRLRAYVLIASDLNLEVESLSRRVDA